MRISHGEWWRRLEIDRREYMVDESERCSDATRLSGPVCNLRDPNGEEPRGTESKTETAPLNDWGHRKLSDAQHHGGIHWRDSRK